MNLPICDKIFFNEYLTLFLFQLSLYFTYSINNDYKINLMNLVTKSMKKISQILKYLLNQLYSLHPLSLLLSSHYLLLINNKPIFYSHLKILKTLKKLFRQLIMYLDLKILLLHHFLNLCFCKEQINSIDLNSSKNNKNLLFCMEPGILRNYLSLLFFILSFLNNLYFCKIHLLNHSINLPISKSLLNQDPLTN
jgi:hypothetical protein